MDENKFLGIDYGTKKVGIAISDERGSFAFPKCVLKNDKNLLENILQITKEESISAIVIGESTDYKGKDNPIMKKIYKLKEFLEQRRFAVILEPEFLTSVEARRANFNSDMLDASAAALILQSYLDKKL